MNKKPFVTIGVPTYNSERYLRDCLDSILKQTYSNFEIIVSDNGSTDNTEKIVFSYNEPKIKFNKNADNLYCYGNYNKIISLAKGELITFYHSDDMYDSYIVEKEVEFLQKHSEIAAVFTEADLINPVNSIIGELISPRKFLKKEILNFNAAYGGFLEFGDFLICPSAMFVKKIFCDVGLFKEENFLKGEKQFTACDLEMWLRILQKYHIGILHKKLMFYRMHSQQGSFKTLTGNKDFFWVMDYYRSYAIKGKSISRNLWDKYEIKKVINKFSQGQNALINKNFNEANSFFSQFLQPSNLFLLLLKGKNFDKALWAILFVCGFHLGSGMFFQKLAKYLRERRVKKKLKKIGIFSVK